MALYTALLTSCLKDDVNVADGVPSDYMALLDVRALHKGNDLALTKEVMAGASKITGVVISDQNAKNIPSNYVVLQQTSRLRTRGIVLYLPQGASAYKIGDSLEVNVSNAKLVRRKGVLQITDVVTSLIEKVGQNKIYQPTQLTLKELNKNFDRYESTLVKIAHVDATAAGTTISGNKEIVDLVKDKGILHVEPTADFANKILAINASYTGIPFWSNNSGDDIASAEKHFWIRNSLGIIDESGALYENFPEYFEVDDPALAGSGYSGTKNIALASNTWQITNGFLGGEANDRPISGKYAIRFNNNSTSDSWATMSDDLRFGASKVTVWVGSYGASADLGSTWRLEYSQDGGNIWYQIGNDILTTSKEKRQYTFLTDIKGPVRFRVGKVGIGTSTTANQNGRMSVDDFAVYKNPNDDGTGVIIMPSYSNILSWQFNSPVAAGNEVEALATFNMAGISKAVLTRGVGLTPSALPRGFASFASTTIGGVSAVVTSTKALAISQNVYYQVEFDVAANKTVSLTAIEAQMRRSGAGAKNHAWYYSVNGGEFKPTGAAAIFYDGTDGDGRKLQTNYLHNTTDLQNIQGGTNIKLRMYAWGFTNMGSGTFSIGRTGTSTTTPTLTIGGTVQ